MNLSEKLQNSLQSDFCYLVQSTMAEISPLCESEIEKLFGAALLLKLRLSGRERRIKLCPSGAYEASLHADDDVLLIPQYNWQSYRIDFALHNTRWLPALIFIECDGHEFHERTKEQAARDRARDRAVQIAGLPLLRFTGSEIWRDPLACVNEVGKLGAKLLAAKAAEATP